MSYKYDLRSTAVLSSYAAWAKTIPNGSKGFAYSKFYTRTVRTTVRAHPSSTMATSHDGFPILNPDTPLVFIPPVSAAQTTAARYILAVMVGVRNSYESRSS